MAGLVSGLILAIDPGSERTGWIVYDPATATVGEFGKTPNVELIDWLVNPAPGVVTVIEWTAPRGMLASAELFEALWWAGRFAQAVIAGGGRVERLERAEVKRHLLGAPRGSDSQVRRALIDRFGGIGGKAVAVGLKATPGPLYGVVHDVWQALAVAVTWMDQHPEGGAE